MLWDLAPMQISFIRVVCDWVVMPAVEFRRVSEHIEGAIAKALLVASEVRYLILAVVLLKPLA